VAFCVACLITVEFLPVSLLTPMAQDLGISEGVAGSPLPSPPSWRCSPACLSPGDWHHRSPQGGHSVQRAADSPACWSPSPKASPCCCWGACLGLGWRLLGDVGLAHHAPGARADGAKSCPLSSVRSLSRW
jgi:hypothetical protein